MRSSNQTPSTLTRIIRGIILVVFVVPTTSAILHGCSQEVDTACFYWPDTTRTDIDPKVCPSAKEAGERYLPDYDVSGTGELDDGACCYSVSEKLPPSEGCSTPFASQG